ncbi:MAG: hypothetical protein DRP88_07170, partial [Candidatus Neomarinimicrobiota bacterium]
EKNDDDVDYNPEIFVGRVPCTNRKDIENWIEKVLNYEMDPGNGDYGYLVSQFWIQGADITSNPDYVKNHYPSTFTHTIWYNTTIHDATDVVNEMSKNYGIINLYTHGAPNSIRIKPDSYTENNRIYTTDDGTTWGDPSEVAGDGLDGLKNYFHYSVVYSISCDVAAWDDIDISRCPGRSFGEGFTVMYKHTGCVAFLGNTRAGYMSGSPQYGPSMDLHKIFCDLLSSGGSDPESGKSYLHIGVAEAVSRQNYTGSYYHHIRLTHNLLGCPEMEIWTDIPSQFTDVTITDDGSSITVNAGVSGATICVSSGDNGASYHLVADNVSQYTFTTSVRPLYITITKHNYIPYTAVTGGTFTSDEYWFGNMNVLGTVRFDGNSTLTVLPGTKILFEGDYDFAVKSGSRIIAEGTEDQPIYFTAANPSGRRTWGTLFVNGSNNILKHCIVEYGDWGLKLSGSPSPASDNVVENCIFRHNDQGLRIQNNTVDVRNCQMYDNRHNVVLIGNQDVDIEGCRIYNGDRDGIYSSNGNYVELYGNVIENNGLGGSSTRNGIYTNWNEVYYIRSYNTIRNNYSSEVAAYYDDMVDIEYSSVHDDNGYEVYSNSGIIFCTFSWWGECPPDYSQFYGDLILRGYLCSQPAWEGQTSSGGLSKMVVVNLDNNKPDDDNITYESLKEKILTNPYFPKADSLLRRMYIIARKDFKENKYGLRKSFYNFLKNLRKQYPDTKVSKKSLEYMIIWKMLDGDYDKAISHSNEALAYEAGGEKRYIMLNLAYLYSNIFEFSKAEKMIEKCKKEYGIDDRIAFMEETVKNMEYEYNKGYIKPAETPEKERMLVSSDDNIILNSPYPNPFNPITTISFQIPEEARLKAEVFDILGRRVSILADREYTPGVYSINFNGKNLPSGIYFIRIHYDPVDESSKSKVFVRKVLLAK